MGSKQLSNHGTLWRTAWHLGAAYLFTVGDRLGSLPANSDTSQGWRRLPSFRFDEFDAVFAAHSSDTAFVAVEMGGEPLEHFVHPSPAVYILGAEDQGLPPSIVARCTHY